ncbi:MAG: NnrU family protein [Burkholderiaceae bacterium]
MAKLLAALYAGASYFVFLVAFLYSIGFVGNLVFDKTIDQGGQAALASAVVVDLLLLGLFAIQHSVMARPAFKAWWKRVVPEHIERSTYVLLSSLILLLIFWQWRPIATIVWSFADPFVVGAFKFSFWLGWAIVFFATFMINHFDLFGLRQVWLRIRERAYQPPPFTTFGFYRFVRHPLMLGFVIAFWSSATMTVGHLLFAIATTGYILIALQLEERDLRRAIGSQYEDYRRQVPMLIPFARARRKRADDRIVTG